MTPFSLFFRVGGVLALIPLVLMAVFLVLQPEDASLIAATFIVISLPGFFVMAYQKIWKASVRRDTIAFRPLFRRKCTVRFDEPDRVKRAGSRYIVYAYGRRIATIESSVSNFSFFAAVLGTLWNMVRCLQWKLTVSQSTITIQNAYRFDKQYQFFDITEARIDESTMKLYAGGKKIAVITTSNDGYQLLHKRLSKAGVLFERFKYTSFIPGGFFGMIMMFASGLNWPLVLVGLLAGNTVGFISEFTGSKLSGITSRNKEPEQDAAPVKSSE